MRDGPEECKSLKEILELPPSALQGLAGWADAELAKAPRHRIGVDRVCLLAA